MTRRSPLTFLPAFTLVLLGTSTACAQQSEGLANPSLPAQTAGALAADGPAAGALFLTAERFRLPEGGFGEVERGHLFLPMDRSDPASPAISVEVYRFPATTDAGAERSPIFRLFGGPGFEGVTADELDGTWDLSTPLMNAKVLRSAFTNSHLVTVERGTHGAFWQARNASSAFADAIDRFLQTGEMNYVPDKITLPEVDWLVGHAVD